MDGEFKRVFEMAKYHFRTSAFTGTGRAIETGKTVGIFIR